MSPDRRPSATTQPSHASGVPKSLAHLPVVHANITQRTRDEGPTPRQRPVESPPPASPAVGPGVLTDIEARLLRAIAAHPGEPSSLLARRASTSPRRALEVRKALLARGFLREHHVNRAGKGRSAIVLEVTAAGHAALQRAGGVP